MTAQVSTRAGHLPYQRGSEWRQWDLHIHTPGTAREDKFTGWPSFLQALKATKNVSVVGVTDYVSIANYEQLIRHKKDAKLGSIDLLIPNIEFRVTPQTDKGHAVNLHLLIDPTEPAHCDEINHALARLSIEYQRQPYSCTRAGITKLGAAYNHDLTDDDARYREGVNQFKVDFAVFWKWYENEAWLRQHSLVCAAGGNDGPSGIKDSGWAAKQEEIWRSANIIFSANQNNRAFWLAEGGDKSDGAKKLGAPKPCFHGSDAHCLDDLFKPSPNGFCWIKGDPTFEGLRQTVFEPKERVYIGNHPPVQHDASRVISEISIGGGGTAAFRNLKLGLNSGLVTIIGQKGSGKSALTDLLAYAAGKDSSADSDSFISRAAEYLSGTAVTLTWLDGHTSKAVIGDKKQRRADVRYTQVRVLEIAEEQSIPGPAARAHGDVLVRSQVVGFKKIKFFTNENVGSGKLELPENEMHTTAFWLTVGHEFLGELPCTLSERQAGIFGLLYALGSMATLLLKCDRRDLGTAVGERPPSAASEINWEDFAAPRASQNDAFFEPNLYIYDAYPGGIGFSESLYRIRNVLLERTHELIVACPCENGCPSCVGPAGDKSERSKEVALAILQRLLTPSLVAADTEKGSERAS